MERYDEYKDSGTELVPTIPVSWESIPLKFAADCNIRVLSENTDEDAEINYIDIGSVEYGKGIGNVQKLVFSKAPSRARRIVRTGDTIISTVRTYLKAVAYIDEQYDNHICSTGFAVFTPKAGMDKKFFSYALLDYDFILDVERRSVGVSYPAITSSVLGTLKAIFPPIGEQTAIASYLNHRIAEIDELISNLQSQAGMLDTYKRELIADLVMHGLDKNVPFKDSGIGWIGEIPNGWSTIRAKWLLNERNIRSKEGLEEPLSMSQKYGLIPTEEMDRIPNMASSFVNAKIVRNGDLVFNKLKAHLGVFSVSRYDGLVSPDYAVYYSTGKCELKYLEYLFKTPLYINEFRKKSTGVAQGLTRLYTEALFSIRCHFPPKEEQEQIAAYLDDKTAQVDGLITDINEQIAKLKQYRQIVIHDAVTGKIKIPGVSSNGN